MKTKIIGIGQTKFGELWDKSAEDLMVDVFKEVLEDAGIEKKDIQASIDKLVAFRAQVKKYVDAKTPPEKAAELMKFPEGENPFYQQNFKKVVLKVYSDIKNAKK